MRISPLSSKTFQGVTLIGTVKTREPVLLDEQIQRAKDLYQELIQKGKNVFLLDYVIEDVNGNPTNTVSTYILTGREAKIVNKNDKTISELEKYRNPLNGDLSIRSLEDVKAIATAAQKKIATFIALNYPTTKLKTLKPFIK